MSASEIPPLRERCMGTCDTCGMPVLVPSYRDTLPDGYKGCQCEAPALVTWEDVDREYAAWKAGEPERTAAYNAAHPMRPDNFTVWKKRAKRL